MSNHFLSSSPKELKAALDDVNRKMEEDETKARASSLGLPYIDLHNFPVDLQVLGMISEEDARQMGAVAFYKELDDLRLGATAPENPQLLSCLDEFKKQGNKVSLYLISHHSLVQTMRFYGKVLKPKAPHEDTVRVEKEKDFAAELKTLANEDKQKTLSATELVETMFGASLFYKSSDIHIEPEEHFVKLRFRVDGVLVDVLHIAKTLQRQLTTRIKILSKMKLNVENVPQDGRITFYYLSKPIDVRVSVLPSAYGEEIVMRLLGTGAVSLKLSDLGFRESQQELLRKLLHKPNGSIITTGPTGSGKTTSLYAFLNELNQPGVKIITLEDPVEYKLEGIVQTPIDHSVDFDFAKGLRAILRQDPDVVMVGEIRDQETAEVAMQAALTGHMVLSTLHTNDAAGAIPRLINMGVKPFILSPALSAVLAQRLVRKLCQFCKQPADLDKSLLEKITVALKAIPQASEIALPKTLKFYHSAGCDKCNNLGYSGRVGIYEILTVTTGVQDLILKQASMNEFRQEGAKQGMLTMLQDGLLKALDGLTDVEEVFRVAGESQ